MAAPQLKPVEIIDDYLSVFAKANPGRPRPKIVYEKGWYTFQDSSPVRYRRHEIERLAVELRRRIAEAKAKRKFLCR